MTAARAERTSWAQLALHLVARDLAQRYRGTTIGALWPFLYGVLQIATFTFVFSLVLNVRWSAGEASRPSEGALMIFAGLLPYFFVAEVFTRAPSCITSVPNLVKKVPIRLELLPIVVVVSAATLALINLVLLAVATLLLWGSVPATALLLPLVLIPLGAFALGVAFLLAALGVFFRDAAQFSPLVAQLIMFLAPVCYPRSAVPAQFADVVALNPLTWFVDTVRLLALEGRAPDPVAWLLQLVLWSAFAAGTLMFFRRTRRSFADLL